MNQKNTSISLLLALVFALAPIAFPTPLRAQSDSAEVALNCWSPPVVMPQKTWLIGLGSAEVLDTYLSQEKHRGFTLQFVSQTEKPARGKHMSQVLDQQISLLNAHNRADNGNQIGADYRFQYALRHNWLLAGGRLRLNAGGGVDANIGFLYNTRNGNNPVQAKLALNLAPSASAEYTFYRRHHSPLYLRYEATFPLAGLMFSPNYGQSYYEIFNRGNYDHNVVPTTVLATPSLRHALTLDFKLWGRWVRAGYMGDYRQSSVNNLKYHSYSHMLVVGVTTRGKKEK